MPSIEDTIAFIKKAHAGQTTKGGEPYWTHPVAVMKLLPAEATVDEQHAALLHDVIEDCGLTGAMLRQAGYSERTIALVEQLSRPVGAERPSYLDWIRSIVATGDRGLMLIKLADNRHNADPQRVAQLPEHERGMVERYRRSMQLLEAALAT